MHERCVRLGLRVVDVVVSGGVVVVLGGRREEGTLRHVRDVEASGLAEGGGGGERNIA